MGNKDNLENGKYDLIVIKTWWWDDSHNWNPVTEGYHLLKNIYENNRKEAGVALYLKITA